MARLTRAAHQLYYLYANPFQIARQGSLMRLRLWVQVLKEIAPETTRAAVVFNPRAWTPFGRA